jgi:hypothetical protein
LIGDAWFAIKEVENCSGSVIEILLAIGQEDPDGIPHRYLDSDGVFESCCDTNQGAWPRTEKVERAA